SEGNDQRVAGIDEPSMMALIQSGKLRQDSNVWKKGFVRWVKVKDTTLRIHLDKLIPSLLTRQHLSNKLVWELPLAPALRLFAESFVAMLVYGDEDWAMDAVSDGKFFYITIALNILLSVLDEKRLQKAGHNTSAFKGWVWLVPVYLYQRTRQLKQSLAYFIVWIVCFVLVLLGAVV